MKKFFPVLFILLVLSVLFFVFSTTDPFVEVNGERFFVKLAITQEEQAQGLMYRDSLSDNKGMLFIFEDEKLRTFWMKNTLIPLDIVFINSDLEVVDVERAVPCEIDPCSIYPSDAPAKYVLEVNVDSGIRTGDLVVINNV